MTSSSPAGAQRPAQLRDADLQCGRRRAGRLLAPQLVDQPVARDDLAGVQQQDRQQRPLPRAGDVDAGRPSRQPRAVPGSGTPSRPHPADATGPRYAPLRRSHGRSRKLRRTVARDQRGAMLKSPQFTRSALIAATVISLGASPAVAREADAPLHRAAGRHHRRAPRPAVDPGTHRLDRCRSGQPAGRRLPRPGRAARSCHPRLRRPTGCSSRSARAPCSPCCCPSPCSRPAGCAATRSARDRSDASTPPRRRTPRRGRRGAPRTFTPIQAPFRASGGCSAHR